MTTANQLFHEAWQFHQAGSLDRAEEMYRRVVQAERSHADAWHLLGMTLLQSGRHAEACDAIHRAAELNPGRVEYHNHLGAAMGGAGRMVEAEASFRRARELAPDDAQVRFNLAGALAAIGRADEAIEEYRHAIRLQPRFPEALFNLANLLRDLGRIDDAIDAYRKATAINPRYQKAWVNLAGVLLRQERLDESAAAYRRVLEIQPQHADALFQLGSILQSHGRLAEAADCLQAALMVRPDHADTHNNLGCTLRGLERSAEAVGCFRQAIDIKPDFAEAYNNLGTALDALKQHDEAAAAYRHALALREDFSEAHANLAGTLKTQKKFDDAISHGRRAAELQPKSASAYINLGSALQAAGHFDEAMTEYGRALELDPQSAEAHHNLATCLQAQNLAEQAIAHYDETIRLKTDHAEAYYNRALVWLSLGDFTAGWKDYDWRLKCKEYAARSFVEPMWDGSPLAGRTLLLYAEQGLGDALQFIRYVPLVDRLGGTVIVEVPKTLTSLVCQSGFHGVVPRQTPLPHFDLQAPLLSLPRIFRTTLDTVPAEVPYLLADPVLVAAWREKLAAIDGFRIGINWQGNPSFAMDRFRSVPLAEFAPLAAVPGVRLISLQKKDGVEQLAQIAGKFTVVDLGPDVDESAGPLMDTAAIVKNLDLVITSDSMLAHLAGALGAPVWVALGHTSEWRWLVNRDDSPWYPTMRLFRQTKPGDWESVFHRMANELLRLATSKGAAV